MPVSSPSYFPPQRATDRIVGLNAGLRQTGNRVFLAGLNAGTDSTVSDLIVIGSSAGSGGLTDASMPGTIIVGSGALTGAGITADNATGLIAIGTNVLATAIGRIGDSVYIGYGAGQNMLGSATSNACGNTVIGNQALGNVVSGGAGVPLGQNVIIGFRASRGSAVGVQSIISSVIIGDEANRDIPAGGGGSLASTVIIGHGSGLVMGNSAGNTIVGSDSAGALSTGANNSFLGQGIGCGALNHANIAVGQAVFVNGSQNVILGWQANPTNAAFNSKLLIEITDSDGGSGRQSLIFGDFPSGCLILGSSTSGTNRDTPAARFNYVKLLNDGNLAAPGAAPVGGGWLRCTTANNTLRWIDSTGQETLLTPAAGQMAASVVAYTNNAGAQVATITNGPTAGNPTKWIPINDNGTVRNIPAW